MAEIGFACNDNKYVGYTLPFLNRTLTLEKYKNFHMLKMDNAATNGTDKWTRAFSDDNIHKITK